MTKAEMLKYLQSNISNCIIDDFLFFTVNDWLLNKDSTLKKIQESFVQDILIIRSSSVCEDTTEDSCAGKYSSIQNVNSSSISNIEESIEIVIQSYDKDSDFLNNQIIVQRQLKNSNTSGVVFNYEYRDNTSYYIIEYDDFSGKTDTITGFGERKRLHIARCNYTINEKWEILISVISQIEKLFPSQLLDIEFAFDNKGELHIFQTRILKKEFASSEIDTEQLSQGSSKFSDYQNGGITFFSNMSDWNPIEMLGVNPKPFSISLYRSLISNKTWKESRKYLGYYSPDEDHLIDVFCGKPYVNVAASLLSLTPDNIPHSIRKKIVESALKKLNEKKYLHDKIEFELALSSMFIDSDSFTKRLQSYSLSDEEIIIYKKAIQNLTINMFDNYILFIDHGNKALLELNQAKDYYNGLIAGSWDKINAFQLVVELIDKTSKLGLFYFSVMARLAFVGDHSVKQMLSERIITEREFNNFYSELKTIPFLINESISNVKNGHVSPTDFLNNFGHLRISTYDLLSPRYFDVYEQLFSTIDVAPMHNTPRENSNPNNKHIFLSYSINDILDFTKNTIEYREYFKFEFTKTVSSILEIVKKIARFYSIDFIDFSYLTVSDFLDFDSRGSKKTIIDQKIKLNKRNHINALSIKLPDVFSEITDFYYFEEIMAKPNFITFQNIKADVFYIENAIDINPDNIKGKLVLMETMEPGCDWILLYSIAGIITKFGGVASHIAIRCRELDIPAVIGCGAYFESYKRARTIQLDASNEKVTIIT